MGSAASLFFSSSDNSNSLDWRIRPSDDQYEQQQERWNDAAAFLVDDLKAQSGYTIGTWLQGSYKFGTQVRPPSTGSEFDIDLGIYFKWQGSADDGDYGPNDLKSFVRSALIKYAEDPENEADRLADSKPRCERLHFNPDFHLDVPCYHLDPDADERQLATQDGDWEKSDPKTIYRWWKDSFSDSELPRMRRLVRYLKMWAALKFEERCRPSSIMLTVLAAEAWQGIDSSALTGEDECFAKIVQTIISRLEGDKSVENPVDRDEDLNRLEDGSFKSFMDELRELRSIAERAIATSSKTIAGEIWGEAFEHFFPLPEDDDTTAVKSAGALMPILFVPEVEVEAVPEKQTARTFTGINEIGPIPKKCEIKFRLMNAHELPLGATVTWTARNQGDEAEDKNDLGHRWKDSQYEVIEHSAYRGNHFMDVSVYRQGALIGRRRIPVKITNILLPPRNPPRPGWTRLRGRR